MGNFSDLHSSVIHERINTLRIVSIDQGWAINLARGPLWEGRDQQRAVLSDAVFLNRFRFVPPFGIFTQPATPFLLFFFNTYDIITIVITTKCISRKIQRIAAKLLILQKRFSEHLISNGNWISQTFLMRRLTLQQYDQLRNLWLSVEQCWSLITSSTFLRSRAFVLVWFRGNNPLSQRYIVANKNSIRKKQFRQLWEWFANSSPEPKKAAFYEKYNVLMNYSENHKIGHVILREYWL